MRQEKPEDLCAQSTEIQQMLRQTNTQLPEYVMKLLRIMAGEKPGAA